MSFVTKISGLSDLNIDGDFTEQYGNASIDGSLTLTDTLTLGSSGVSAAGTSVQSMEISYLSGVTSGIQGQINSLTSTTNTLSNQISNLSGNQGGFFLAFAELALSGATTFSNSNMCMGSGTTMNRPIFVPACTLYMAGISLNTTSVSTACVFQIYNQTSGAVLGSLTLPVGSTERTASFSGVVLASATPVSFRVASGAVNKAVNMKFTCVFASAGVTGAPANMSIGTVSTLIAGSNATASLSGTAPNYSLSFGIPRGADGATGAAPNLSIGSVTSTTGSPSVAITGTSPNYQLNFALQKGDAGVSGSNGQDAKNFNFRNDYLTTAVYNKYDIVNFNGSSYAAMTDNVTQIPPTNNLYWQLIASMGSTPQLTIGTVTDLSNASVPTVTIDGTSLSFGLVRGADGSDGHSLNFRGTWSSSETYNEWDVVTYNGSTYYCQHDGTVSSGVYTGSNGVSFPVNNDSPDLNFFGNWLLLASKGDTGSSIKGDKGDPGEDGKDYTSDGGTGVAGVTLGALGFLVGVGGAAISTAGMTSAQLATTAATGIANAAESIDPGDFDDEYEKMSLQNAIDDLRTRTQNLVNNSTFLGKTTTSRDTYHRGSLSVYDRNMDKRLFHVDNFYSNTTLNTYNSIEFAINDKFSVTNSDTDVQLLKLDKDGLLTMTSGNNQATISGSKVKVAGLTSSVQMDASAAVWTGLIDSTTITPSAITTTGVVNAAQTYLSTGVINTPTNTTTNEQMLLSGGLSSAQQTLVRYNGICTSTITSQPTGTTNLSIDINQYDTGDGVISIGPKWAREIKLGNQYCDVLIYDGGGFARLNQIPRTAAPPRKGNIFDIYG